MEEGVKGKFLRRIETAVEFSEGGGGGRDGGGKGVYVGPRLVKWERGRGGVGLGREVFVGVEGGRGFVGDEVGEDDSGVKEVNVESSLRFMTMELVIMVACRQRESSLIGL